jgi:hypothetical protein
LEYVQTELNKRTSARSNQYGKPPEGEI